MEKKEIKSEVKKRYAGVALGREGCCGSSTGAASAGREAPRNLMGKRVGYSDEELRQVPEGANLGLGCGNPVALASLKPGEVVLDLGSGAGFDSFLAAARVGPSGKVIGVDMTPEMLEKARGNAEKGHYTNVEFRQGEIESLPISDETVDVILSNCVINLSPDKPRVFGEAFRVLKPGGRLMVSDLVLTRPLPEAVEKSIEAYTGCVAGAALKADYLAAIRAAGFTKVEIQRESIYPIGSSNPDETEKAVLSSPGLTLEDRQAVVESVVSISVLAVKP